MNPTPGNDPHKRPVLIAGPTGSGKTSFAVALAKRVGGEIICADAFQVYQGMAVLTAQPAQSEQQGIAHHLFGFVDPARHWDVADWLEHANKAVEEVTSRGAVPILVGGTGLYLKAFTHGLDPAPPSDPTLRRELDALPLPELRKRLAALDPRALDLIDPQNPRRVQRAIEIVSLSGKPLEHFRSSWSKPGRPLAAALRIVRERDHLHARIRANVLRMLESGAVEEVASLLRELASGETTPATGAIGYREISDLLAGRVTRKECCDRIITATCQYARRQETWLRRQPEFIPLEVAPDASWQALPGGLDGHMPES